MVRRCRVYSHPETPHVQLRWLAFYSIDNGTRAAPTPPMLDARLTCGKPSVLRPSGLGEDCFEVGSHDVGHPTHRSVSPERVSGTAARTPSVFECLDSDVDSNLVSLFKAIRDRLRDSGDADVHPINDMLLDAGTTSFTGESYDPKGKIKNDWRARFSIDREPDL
jgi:hypothetical protein